MEARFVHFGFVEIDGEEEYLVKSWGLGILGNDEEREDFGTGVEE